MRLIRRNIITLREAEKLIEKYYEGETSVDEENQLRTFLAQSNVTEQFEAEKAIFGYFEHKKSKKQFTLQPYRRWMAVAAVLAGVIISVSTFQRAGNTNYAFVDGEKITEIQTVKSLAYMTMVSLVSDNNEVEDGLDNLRNDEMIKNQLDEFSGIELLQKNNRK